MPSSFLGPLLDEIAALEAALEGDGRYIKLRELRRVLGLYEQSTNSTTADSITVVAGSEPRVPSGRRPSPHNERVLQIARIFLANRGSHPTPTRAILDHLEQEGVPVGGEMPVNTLSAMLSNSTEFLSRGRAGWTTFDNICCAVSNDLLQMAPSKDVHIAVAYWDKNRELQHHFQVLLLKLFEEKVGRSIEIFQQNRLFSEFIERARSYLSIEIGLGGSINTRVRL